MARSLILAFFFLFAVVSCQKETLPIINLDIKKDTQSEAYAYKFSSLGDAHYAVKKFDSAYYYYNKSKELFVTVHDSSFVGYTLLQLARIQQTYGDFGNSEETLTEALPYIENNIPYQNGANNLFGIAAKELKNYEDAVGYYKKVLAATQDSILKVTPLNNIAAVYTEQEKYDQAIRLLEPLVNASLLDGLPFKKALVMDNLGFAYAKYKQEKKGLDLMYQALAMRQELDDSYGSIESYLHLADYYKDTQTQKVKENALKAYILAKKCASLPEQLEALSYLMRYNNQKGENKYASQFVHLNDSLKKVQNNAKNQFAKIRYDSRKATLENIKIKNERANTLLQFEKQKNQKNISFFGLILLGIGSVYSISYFIRKNKRDRLAASYAAETRIAKALHDELANDVFYTMSFAETQDLQNPLKKETLLTQLDKIYGRTRNFSKENSLVETGVTFEANLKEMLNSYKSNETEIIIKNGNAIDWSKVTAEKKVALYRIFQELMVNMKKHSKASVVVIGFDTEEKEIKMDYSDNGIGFSETLILKNGLQNAENRIHAVNGRITFESETNKGFRAKIVLPK